MEYKYAGPCFSVTSAHDPAALNFGAFAGIDTCVFLMVGKSLPTVVEELVTTAGKSSETPVAVIRWGCTPKEEVYRGSLGSIVEVTRGRELSPCILVVGAVARGGQGA